jgi:hypothetical protein
MYITLILLASALAITETIHLYHKMRSRAQVTKLPENGSDDFDDIIDGPAMHVTLYGGPLDGRDILVGKDTIGYGDDQTGSLYYFCPEVTARLGRYAFAHQTHPISALS